MKEPKTKITIGVLSALIVYVCLNSLVRTTRPGWFVWSEEDREDTRWRATSRFWIDRKACRWLALCGLAHVVLGDRAFTGSSEYDVVAVVGGDSERQDPWHEGKQKPEDWSDDERVLREIPDFVLEHAPLVHLYSGEQFWPSDLSEHLSHITTRLNYTPLNKEWQNPTVSNLDQLNEFEHGRWIFLQSKDDPEEKPAWLTSETNIPKPPQSPAEHRQVRRGRTDRQVGVAQAQPRLNRVEDGEDRLHAVSDAFSGLYRKYPITDASRAGRSKAPAFLIVVDKGHGVVDAFWFFFYSFNLGLMVLNVRFGNHVGDWEHSAVRFVNGIPQSVYFSEHSFGAAYTYEAVEKTGKRPVIYSATGSHAMYATPGSHPYILPLGILHDETDKGPLWDPLLNLQSYTYDYRNDTLRSSTLNPQAPTEWFYFAGHWGDKFYRLSDSRQYRIAGQYHYVNGPIGPRFKNLGRRNICGGPDSRPCHVQHYLSRQERMRHYHGVWEGEDLSHHDQEKFFGNETTAGR